MIRRQVRLCVSVGALAMALAASGAGAKSTYVQPYVEVTQVATADLVNDDDLLTYTQVAAGIDAGISGPRADAQVSYRYERRIQYQNNINDDDVHSGLARGTYRFSPALSFNGGALATRSRVYMDGAAPGALGGNVDNISQVYSVYGGPSLATAVGPAQLSASYQAAYTKMEAPHSVGTTDGRRLDYFDDSLSHLATVSLGTAAGTILPVGVTVSGAYDREDAGQLDQSYEGYYGRGDLVLPVSRTVALRAGAGYEKIVSKQRDALVDATGAPVLDGHGRYVTDPASPPRIAYNTDGAIYDAGVIWKPSPRLTLAANAGYRYGGETYTGALNWQMTRDVGVQVVVYDGIETFGRQLRDGLRDLPTNFTTQPDPFGQQFAGCIFGSKPGSGGGGGAGGCLNNALQSASNATYRARGVDAVLSAVRGRTSFGVGLGYANRKLFQGEDVPGITLYGAEDQSAYLQAYWSRALTRRSTLSTNIYGNWYSSGYGMPDVWAAGGTGTYNLNFGKLGTLASLGVYTYDSADIERQWSLQALLGARYNF